MVITPKANDISEHKLDKLARAFRKVRFLDHYRYVTGRSGFRDVGDNVMLTITNTDEVGQSRVIFYLAKSK